MCCTRIGTVFGGTWPASIWRAFMSVATANMRVKDFPVAPASEYVTLRIDFTRGCLANPYTPPQEVETRQYVKGSEPTLKVCTEPTAYQSLIVPSVVGLQKDDAIQALRAAGFNVAIGFADSDEPPDTVIDQDPRGGASLVQTGTVTITVARARAPDDGSEVPNVVGMTQGQATSVLRRSGFAVAVREEAECDPNASGCDYRSGIVWSQSPGGGQAPEGSTVTILVNP